MPRSGKIPIIGRHSTIDRPLSVNRVMPPTTIMEKIVIQTTANQLTIILFESGIGGSSGSSQVNGKGYVYRAVPDPLILLMSLHACVVHSTTFIIAKLLIISFTELLAAPRHLTLYSDSTLEQIWISNENIQYRAKHAASTAYACHTPSQKKK